MSDYPTITNSPLRDRTVVEAVLKCIAEGKPPSFGNVQDLVRDKFEDLGDDELAVAVNFINSERVREGQAIDAPPETQENIEPPRAAEDGEPHNDTASEATDPDLRTTWPPGEVTEPVQPTAAQVRDAIADMARTVEILRGDKMTAEQKLRDARDALASAVFAWQTHGTGQRKSGYSREMLVRDHIKASQEYRLAVAEGRAEPPQRPKGATGSFRDRVGQYRGDADTFVRRYQGVHTPLAPGVTIQKGDSRGAFDRSALGRTVRPRLPSER